jgi:hypothetical protein
MEGKELVHAFIHSEKSHDEILAFMNGKNRDHE